MSRVLPSAAPRQAGSAFETYCRGHEEALLHRVDERAPLTDNGRRFRGMTLLEQGREYLRFFGTHSESRGFALAGEVLAFRGAGLGTSSDFSALLANSMRKRLRQAYVDTVPTYMQWATRASDAPDFKPRSVVIASAAPDLLRTNEAGEFSYGRMADGAETYSVITYGRILGLTRQAIVNDDLRGFDTTVRGFAQAARRLENRLVYAQLTGNPVMADGQQLFSAPHANLHTGGASALSFSALAIGRAGMRQQTGLQGEPLNLVPSFLLVPAALEQAAYQLTSSALRPSTTGEINEFREGGRSALVPVVEPVLDSASASAWYLAASGSRVDTVEYCYLDGADSVVLDEDVGFEVDGVGFRGRLDFAAKVIDHRGLRRAVGV